MFGYRLMHWIMYNLCNFSLSIVVSVHVVSNLVNTVQLPIIEVKDYTSVVNGGRDLKMEGGGFLEKQRIWKCRGSQEEYFKPLLKATIRT